MERNIMDISSPVLVPFLIPIVFVIFMLIMQLTLLLVAGIGFDLDHDHDVDLDADIDVDVDIDVSLHPELEGALEHSGFDALDHDFDHDHDFDLDHDHDGFSLGRFLSPLGVGQVPLSVIWNAYALSFGLGGITLSVLLAKFFAVSFWFLGLTIPLALIFGWHVTKKASKIVMPLLKTHGIAEDRSEIIGRMGRVTSSSIDSEWGEAVVMINGQSNHMIVRAADDEVIDKNSEVVIIGYDTEKKRPIVGKVKA